MALALCGAPLEARAAAGLSLAHEPATLRAVGMGTVGRGAAPMVEVLDEVGPENVRAVLAQNAAGSGAAIPIGAKPNMTKGFAQAWLAWHDSEKAKRESAFRTAQVFWTRWAALAASLAAIAAAVGWGFSILFPPSRLPLEPASDRRYLNRHVPCSLRASAFIVPVPRPRSARRQACAIP